MARDTPHPYSVCKFPIFMGLEMGDRRKVLYLLDLEQSPLRKDLEAGNKGTREPVKSRNIVHCSFVGFRTQVGHCWGLPLHSFTDSQCESGMLVNLNDLS